VAQDAVFLEEISSMTRKPSFWRQEGDGHRLRRPARGNGGPHGQRVAIGDDPIDDAVRTCFLDGAEMVGEGTTGGSPGWVIRLATYTRGALDLAMALGDFRVSSRENAGVERAGTSEDQVGLP